MLDDDTNAPENDLRGAETPGDTAGAPTADPTPVAEEPERVEAAPAPAKKAAAKRTAAKRTTTRKTAARKTAAAAPVESDAPVADGDVTASTEGGESTDQVAPDAGEPAPAAKKATTRKTAAKKTTTRKTATKRTAAKKVAPTAETADETLPGTTPEDAELVDPAAPVAPVADDDAGLTAAAEVPATTAEATDGEADAEETPAQAGPAAALVFQPPDPSAAVVTRRTRSSRAKKAVEAPAPEDGEEAAPAGEATAPPATDESGRDADTARDGGDTGPDGSDDGSDEGGSEGGGARRRRRRGGRRRRKSGDNDQGGSDQDSSDDEPDDDSDSSKDRGQDRGKSDDKDSGDGSEGGGTRRRRRRRRAGEDGGDGGDDPENTVTRVRKPRSAEDEITAISGSTRLEAKKQRRREGREAGRRRAPIVSEAEFLARRESVDRTMVIRQKDDLTQIAVLEDKVLVEHYVARESQTSLIGNVYLGRVQNVLPSMEAAFIDIGKGRNAVLYAGEVNWSALGHKDGQPRKIESVLSSGQSVLVQVTKDPVGHKGARLTSQVSLAGRFLVYVPDGTTSGISRKLPDTERSRLKTLLKEIVPDTAGVIVRTAAEGAAEDELTRDVERLKARWEDIEKNAKSGSGPKLLYGEPDLTLKVVRDLFTEDFGTLVIQGDDAWDTVHGYVTHVAPDLEERLERFTPDETSGDVFAAYRIDEQIAKGLDRKVWLPSGGSLIIDRTEAMTVVDVNTGKFTGSGGNLEETVTKNNLEAAEEIVRQLRLRDIGGIIVVDFIDMVLESNRDLVLRRLVECLGRDRTRHQVAEVTSLGLVQMTRKRIGTGLLEAFSENCEHCQGRGLVLHDMPVEPRKSDDDGRRGSRRGRSRGKGDGDGDGGGSAGSNGGGGNGGGRQAPSPKDVAAMARAENADKAPVDEQPATDTDATQGGSDGQQQKQEQDQSTERQGRSRSGRRRGGRGSGGASAEQDQPEETGPSPEAEPVEQPTPAEQAPDEPEQAPAEPEQAPVAAASEPAEPETAEPEPAPVAAEPEPAPAETPTAPAPPAAPKVVTRTRRRSASRPAGPPTGTDVPGLDEVPPTGGVGSPSDGRVEPGVVGVEPGLQADAPASEGSADAPELHVPVKKKGSRKR